jgi:hypothetical protein
MRTKKNTFRLISCHLHIFIQFGGDPDLPSSQVIFAPRGGGKSAQRRMIEYNAASADVFVITYDRFEKLGVNNLEELSIEYHLRNIIEIGLLGFLLEYHERGMRAPSFTKVERDQIDKLSHYYLSAVSKFEALEALNSLKTLSAKAKQFLREWSGPVNTLFNAALTAKGIPHPKIDLSHGAVPQETSNGPLKAHLGLGQTCQSCGTEWGPVQPQQPEAEHA